MVEFQDPLTKIFKENSAAKLPKLFFKPARPLAMKMESNRLYFILLLKKKFSDGQFQ